MERGKFTVLWPRPAKMGVKKMVKILIDEEYRQMLPQVIAGAKKDLRLMVYRVQRKLGRGRTESNMFLDEIKDRVRCGVRVWLIIDFYPRPGMAYRENMYTASILMDHGVNARYLKDSRVCHAKSVIVDDEVAVIGSHNWTTNSLKRNFEVSVLIQGKEEVKKLKDEFDKLFQEGYKF
jgi:phosphatidylserine/phosphatidylglycerophosphate/cardiolipin synthase-like enzyme